MLSSILNILLLLLGFGFVIFWHELGHFLAAKWVGIKVEQFAVGFGSAMVAWRKGIGFTFGTSREQYEALTRKHLREKRASSIQLREKTGDTEFTDLQLSQAAVELGLGDTEYRLNWIPLGGYVKMLGQDDLRPGEQLDDPRAYPNKSIRARMLVVSAGVIMNVILAAIGFMLLFLYGFHAPAPIVGNVLPGSPAQASGMRVGDRIAYMDGSYQHDFTKITLSTALLSGRGSSPVVVQHPDGTYSTLDVTPRKFNSSKGANFLGIGIEPSPVLVGPTDEEYEAMKKNIADGTDAVLPGTVILQPHQIITKINGAAVDNREFLPDGNPTSSYWQFDQALQKSSPEHPVVLTIVDQDGKGKALQPVLVVPKFEHGFDEEDITIAGLPMLAKVYGLAKETSATGILEPGDVLTSITITDKNGQSALADYPSDQETMQLVHKAGDDSSKIDLRVLRDGKLISLPTIHPTVKVADHQYGMGVQLDFAEDMPMVAANKVGVPAGATILSIDGKPVKNWFDIRQTLENGGERKVTIAYREPMSSDNSTTQAATQPVLGTTELAIGPDQLTSLDDLRYTSDLVTPQRIIIRKTSNPLIAASWGITETRDFILQFYVTLQRMVEGSVDARNLMGPVGIAQAGFAFASRGFDWLIWFLSMISANLAVVNFLPIPIVDGGLFTFLILEKIQGKPLSHRAQQYLQIVGFALIIGVFLLVTYQDILRLVR